MDESKFPACQACVRGSGQPNRTDSTAAMVPRDTEHTPRSGAVTGAFTRMFESWRRMLGIVGGKLRSASRRMARKSPGAEEGSAPRSRRGVVSFGGLVASPSAALTAGLIATVIGAVATQLISPAREQGQAVALVVVNVLWVVARLLVMRLANGEHTTVGAPAITRAWSAGALLQAVAVTPALRTLAWLIGAVLTQRALVRSGASHRDSLRLVLWGYGIEFAGFFLVAAGRNVDVAVRVFTGG